MARSDASTAATPGAKFGDTLGTGGVGDLGALISASVPDEIPFHFVSDDDLDVLCDPSRDELWELKWATLGGVIGTLPAAAEAVYTYATTDPRALSILSLFQILVFTVSLAVWLVLRFVVPKKQAKSNARRDEIRTRTRRLNEERHA